MSRSETVLLENLPWRTEHDLRFADQDGIGHVNNGVFGSLIESNRASLVLDHILTVKSEFLCVVGRFEIDYINEMRWPGRVLVATKVERVGNTSLTLRHGLFTQGMLCAAARSILVLISKETRRPVAITESQRTRAQHWAETNQHLS